MNKFTGQIRTLAEVRALPVPEQAEHIEMAVPPTLPQRVRGKIGRNEKCPCGSGKKFKRCHLERMGR